MAEPDRQRVEELFQQSVALPLDQRADLLDRACPDPDLRKAVEKLLHIHDAGKMETPVLFRVPELPPEQVQADPDRIGRYEILHRVGEGGMGVVYLARQDHPRRLVALKMMKPGLTSTSLLRRFQHEAELLGRLKHPGIAHIYEAGVAPISSARPGVLCQFLAMEYIEGEPLTDYARARHLNARQRMELLARVCDAVHYAHRQGIIHRDLKPANILVQDTPNDDGGSATKGGHTAEHEAGQPKILDFGIARATDVDLHTVTLRTNLGQVVGTIPYMSPEQVSGDVRQLDSRADVYSLGVILFELLSERLPHDLRHRPIAEALRIIRESDPTRLSSINSAFRGEVDTIVGKALEKNKLLRYQSAADLASDIRRYLRDEPIIARPASAFYQISKFVKRHRALVGATLITILALLIGLLAALRQAHVAELARLSERLEKENAVRQAYRATLAAGLGALYYGDAAAARFNLNAVPAAFRDCWESRYLEAQLDESLLTIPIDSLAAEPLLLTADGMTVGALLDGDFTRLVRWDLRTGVQLPEIPSPSRAYPIDMIRGASQLGWWWDFSTREVVIHDFRTATEQRFALGEAYPDPRSISVFPELSSDGRFIAFLGSERIHFVELSTLQSAELPLGEFTPRQFQMAISPDHRVALPAAVNGTAHLWTPATGEIIPLATDSSVVAFAFNADGSRLAGTTQDCAIRIWDGRTGQPLAIGRGHTDVVRGIAFSPDGATVATFGNDRTVRIWDAGTLAPLQVYHGHIDHPTRLVSYVAGGTRLVTADWNATIRVWDATLAHDPCELRGHESYVYPVAFSPSGAMIASGGWDHRVCLWDAASGLELRRLQGHNGHVGALAFSHDGRRLVSRGPYDGLCLWDADSGALLGRLELRDDPDNFLVGFHRDGVHVLLAVDIEQTEALFWDTSSGQVVHRPLNWLAEVRCPARSSDGRFWAAAGDPVRVLDLAKGSSCATQASAGLNTHCVFSPPSAGAARLAIIQNRPHKSLTLICDPQTGSTLGTLTGHTDEVFAASWSPDGTRIATGGRDQVIRLWDTHTYEQMAELRGHSSYVWSLDWSPDGTMLLSGSGDHTVRIWESRPPRERMAARQLRSALPQ